MSDRDPKFTSKYWSSLAEHLHIRLNLSTTNHPKTDCQSEIMIRTLSNMLRSSIQQIPRQWDTALSQLEYEYNASKNASTGLAPFEIDLGYIPRDLFTRSLSECRVQCQSSIDMTERRKAYRQLAKDNLAIARAKQKHYADQHRRKQAFNVGDWVLLRADALDYSRGRNLPKKWQPKYLDLWR